MTPARGLRREIEKFFVAGYAYCPWPEEVKPDLQRILEISWPEKENWPLLSTMCIDAIVHPSAKAGEDSDEMQAEQRAAWRLLGELSTRFFDVNSPSRWEDSMDQNPWGVDAKTAADLLEKTRLQAGEESPVGVRARSILTGSPGIFLKDEELVRLLGDKDPTIAYAAGVKLARKGGIALLRKKARNPQDPWGILRYCKEAGVRPDGEETEIISRSLQSEYFPSTLEALIYFPVFASTETGKVELPECIRTAAIAALERSITMREDDWMSLNNPQRFCKALKMLEAGPFDDSFRSFLNFCLTSKTGYYVNDPQRQMKVFSVRRCAKEMLESHHVNVPPGLVLEQAVPVLEASQGQFRE